MHARPTTYLYSSPVLLWWFSDFVSASTLYSCLHLRSANPNCVHKDTGWTALHWAAYNGSKGCTKALIKSGASIDPEDKEGMTPLMRSAQKGQHRSMQVLLEYGASVDARDKNRWTALHHSAYTGHVVSRLIHENGSCRSLAGVSQLNHNA